MKELQFTAGLVGVILATPPVLPARAAEASADGGITVTSEDGDFSAQIGGRLQADLAFYDEDVTALDDGAEVRRARIFIKGLVYGDWEYKIETDFAENDLEITDAYLKHKPSGLQFGQFKVPFTLEQLTSSRFIPFMERALDGLREGRRLGIGWFGHGDAWSFGASAFGQAVGEDTQGDEGFGAAARGVFRPWRTETGDLVHLGVSTFFQEPSDETRTSRIRQRPWSHVTGVRFADTGVIDNVDSERGVGAEFSSVIDSFSLQAEYVRKEITRDAGLPDEDFDGWYVYGTWMSKGGRRSYKDSAGAYERSAVKPGTWEFGLRYSVLDLQSSMIPGGKQEGWTLGVNYYVNPKLRFMANFLTVETDNSAITRDGSREDIGVAQGRLSFDF